MNIFTKTPPGAKPIQPVVVDIYGGGFNHGSANGKPDKARHFVRNGIVVVKFNYRVGPFGFLSTEDEVVPGNMGLKDQQLALQWVHKNIHLFGGDKNKVTLMGQSARAASVTFHILSKKSAGLFRAAIAMSGSVLNTFSYQRDAAKTAYGLAKLTVPHFGKNKTTRQLIKALQNVPAKDIDATDSTYDAFGPVVEVDHADAFISQPFYDLSTKAPANKVPIFMGMTSEEAIGHGRDLASLKKYAERYDNDPSFLEDQCGCLNICNDEKVRRIVGEKIKKAYTNGSMADDLSTVIKFDSEKRYTKAVIRFAQLQSQFSDVYFYVFSYHGKIGKNDVYVKGAGRIGHAEDAKYMYLDPFDASNKTRHPRRMSFSRTCKFHP
ncbi:unnamed protein product [Callosobruchus maculatus]|nr:unnamed protein product [Callosobruchus maculatus]